ncbi:hypothetical protein BJ165DRAFT_878033 [Panaeolus papilionaceus]|nr:hypothetical protein BJ165DRAFT_878033 [Panaeolus papilionaceus]
MTSMTIIDNVDPSIIFSGVWTRHDSKTGYNNTISLTRSVGNSATVNFIGNSIAVYGMLGPHPPDAPAVTTYQIDGDSPTTYAPASPSTQVIRLLFYQSPTLSYGSHKLVMTNMVDLDWIWLDYFEVTSTGGQPQQPTPRTSGSIATLTRASAGNAPQTTVSNGDSILSPAAPSNASRPTQLSTLSSNTLNQSLSSTRNPSTSNTDQSQFFSPKTTHIDAPTFLASAQGNAVYP